MHNGWVNSLCAGAGGFAGAVLRYWVGLALQPYATVWPLGTLAANVAGCAIMGGIVEAGIEGGAITPAMRVLLTTGFCGGFTTMSSLAYETTAMAKGGSAPGAALYAAGSLALSIAAILAGQFLVRAVTHGAPR